MFSSTCKQIFCFFDILTRAFLGRSKFSRVFSKPFWRCPTISWATFCAAFSGRKFRQLFQGLLPHLFYRLARRTNCDECWWWWLGRSRPHLYRSALGLHWHPAYRPGACSSQVRFCRGWLWVPQAQRKWHWCWQKQVDIKPRLTTSAALMRLGKVITSSGESSTIVPSSSSAITGKKLISFDIFLAFFNINIHVLAREIVGKFVKKNQGAVWREVEDVGVLFGTTLWSHLEIRMGFVLWRLPGSKAPATLCWAWVTAVHSEWWRQW